jgi:hypothetical protein
MARRVYETADASADGVLILTVAQVPWNFPVRLPTAAEALEDWVQGHGFTLTRSQDGRDAEALLRRLGSLDRIDARAAPERIEVLKVLSPRSRVKLARAFVNEAQRAGTQLNEDAVLEKLSEIGLFLELEARTANDIASEMAPGIRKQDVLPLLPPLVENGFVRRLREVRCPQCRFRMLLTLAELDEAVRCRACGARAPLPVTDNSDRREPEFFYRLDGLMARVMDQDVLPVLLTPRALRPPPERGELFFVWAGVEVTKGQRPKVDIDVLISNAAGKVWCFEVKKSGRRLTASQLNKLLEAASELDASPAIAALEGEFPEELTRRVLQAGGDVLTSERLLT